MSQQSKWTRTRTPKPLPRWMWDSLPSGPHSQVSRPYPPEGGSDWEDMSSQSEGTMTPEEESLVDAVLEPMRESGLLAQIKAIVAKFIQENGTIDNRTGVRVIPEMSDEILSCIIEYLQWIGMKETCSALLSESPVRVNHSTVNNPREDYRPTLYWVFDQLPSEQDLELWNQEQDLDNTSDNNDNNDKLDFHSPAPPAAVDDDDTTTTTATKHLDDLIDPVKKVEEIPLDFLPSTPTSKEKPPASDATFVRDSEKTSDTPSSLLMGFDIPLNADGFGGQVKRPLVPEQLCQDNPFLVKKAPGEDEDAQSESQMKLSSLLAPEPDDKPKPVRDEDHPIQPEPPVSESEVLQDEEEMKAFEEEEADLESTEEDLIERSLSTDDSRPSSRENLEMSQAEDQNEVSTPVPDQVEQNEDENLDLDGSNVYEVSDDFEEDLSVSSLPSQAEDNRTIGTRRNCRKPAGSQSLRTTTDSHENDLDQSTQSETELAMPSSEPFEPENKASSEPIQPEAESTTSSDEFQPRRESATSSDEFQLEAESTTSSESIQLDDSTSEGSEVELAPSQPEMESPTSPEPFQLIPRVLEPSLFVCLASFTGFVLYVVHRVRQN